MQEGELRTLFHCGDLKTAAILKIPLTEYWCLQFSRKSGAPILLDSQRVSPRRFKTLDAAFASANSIGFTKATIEAS